jgi:pyruvate formate lyase activating enzyme
MTGRSLAPTVELARRLAERGRATWVRYVLVPGHTDQVDEVEAFNSSFREFDNVQRVDIVPFGELSARRCRRFAAPVALRSAPPAIPELVDSVRARMAHAGLPVR